MSASYDITSAPSSGLRWATGMVTAFTVFAALIGGGCFLALFTRDLPGDQQLSAVVIGCVGAFGTTYGVRGIRAARALARPLLVARLDHDGLHLHEGLGLVDLPDELAWTTVPWAWITSVSLTTHDLRAAKTMGGDEPFEALRFALADDELLDRSPVERPYLVTVAEWLGLTPTQTRTVLLGAPGSEPHRGALAWIQAQRPDVPVLAGSLAPWTTKASPDRWAGRPRVAVVGAHGRLGIRVVEVLTRHEDAVPPVAVVRNEAHRAVLERLGAEVRMLDLDEQGPSAAASALRGCSAVIHVAAPSPASVLAGAQRAGAHRFVLVPGVRGGDEQVALTASSGLAWTAFRPSALTEDPPSGEVDLGLDVVAGPVPRADLAEVIAASIRDEDSVGVAWPIAGVPSSAS